ncbi:MAG: GspH/FimT family protein [Syntrophorhabdaceae bacterium]|nr:GspH/FimT family protein [Syntrophorhabdaceae bacterium]
MKRIGGSSEKLLNFLRTSPRPKGFTSIELIVVIIVLSLLSASIIIKNPFTISDYSSIAADQLIADIQYVQMRAMGIRKPQTIELRIDASDYGIYSVAGARKTLPGNIKVTNTSFTGPIKFDSIGEPDRDGTIDLSGGKTAGGQTIRVQPSTGKANIE